MAFCCKKRRVIVKKIKKPVETYLTRNKLNLDNFTVIKNLEIDLFYKVFKTVYMYSRKVA